MKIGDRVRIIRSPYMAHPSRMVGGKGTIVNIEDYQTTKVYMVKVDECPDDDMECGWAFNKQELMKIS